MAQTRRSLLETVDEQVSARLKVHREATIASLDERARWLLELTRAELGELAIFDLVVPRFFYRGESANAAPLTDALSISEATTSEATMGVVRGHYNLSWQDAEAKGEFFYRQDHLLAQQLINQALQRQLPVATLLFDYGTYTGVASMVEPLIGQRGWLGVYKLRVASVDVDEFLICAACVDEVVEEQVASLQVAGGFDQSSAVAGGQDNVLDEEVCRRLLMIPARVVDAPSQPPPDLRGLCQPQVTHHVQTIDARNADFFAEESEKLDAWAEDLKMSLEQEIQALDKQLRETRRSVKTAISLQEKLGTQKAVRDLESQRKRKRRTLYDAQDEVEERRDALIADIEQRLGQTYEVEEIFVVRWCVE